MIQTSTLGGDYEFGSWTFGASLTYGEAEQDTPWDYGWVFELDNEIPMSYDTSNLFFDVTAGPEFQDASEFEFEETFREQADRRRGTEDGTRSTCSVTSSAGEREGFVKFGAKLVDRNKVSDQDAEVYDGFDGDFLLSDVSRPGDPDFYQNERKYLFQTPVDFKGRAALFRCEFRSGFELSDADTTAESYGVDYEITEKVYAGYLMGQFERHAFAAP